MSEDLLNVMGSFSETALDCIEKQNEEIEQLQQENLQLKNNWKELKEYCKNNYYGITTIGILDKIQELEENK